MREQLTSRSGGDSCFSFNAIHGLVLLCVQIIELFCVVGPAGIVFGDVSWLVWTRRTLTLIFILRLVVIFSPAFILRLALVALLW